MGIHWKVSMIAELRRLLLPQPLLQLLSTPHRWPLRSSSATPTLNSSCWHISASHTYLHNSTWSDHGNFHRLGTIFNHLLSGSELTIIRPDATITHLHQALYGQFDSGFISQICLPMALQELSQALRVASNRVSLIQRRCRNQSGRCGNS